MTSTSMQIKSDTLNLLLCNRMHWHDDAQYRSKMLTQCAKRIRDRTTDAPLMAACKRIILTNKNGNYALVLKAIALAEYNYIFQFRGGCYE